MEQKQRLFIYDRREMGILVVLGVMVAAFAFTLGVHLGKKVTTRQPIPSTAVVPQTDTLQDTLPNKQELNEQAKNAQAAADEELTNSLHREVQKTGIKLNAPKQVDLPSETKSKMAGATQLKNPAAHAAAPVHATSSKVAEEAIQDAARVEGKFTLQVGSFETVGEANERMEDLKAKGLHPFVRTAEISGLGTRYRLFVGLFSSREDAQHAGKKYQAERVIERFLVSRSDK